LLVAERFQLRHLLSKHPSSTDRSFRWRHEVASSLTAMKVTQSACCARVECSLLTDTAAATRPFLVLKQTRRDGIVAVVCELVAEQTVLCGSAPSAMTHCSEGVPSRRRAETVARG
jgi:hypothetical protein